MRPSVRLTGCKLSPGYGSGTAFVYHAGTAPAVVQRSVQAAEITAEQQRFKRALDDARNELQAVRERVLLEIGEAESDIIGSHLLLMEDASFMGRVEARIASDCVNAELALDREAAAIVAGIRDSKSEVLRARSLDVLDIKNRLLKHLGHGSEQALEHLPFSTVVVARDLLPSDTLNLDRANVAGIVLEHGAPHSHAAILARSMGIPAVGCIEGLLDRVHDGERVFVDGERGEILMAPDVTQIEAFTRSRRNYNRGLSQLTSEEWKESITRDGQSITLLANIGRPAEVPEVHRHQLEGVGLFRTEYMFLGSSERPSLEAQRAAYRSVLDRLEGKPLTIRTFDLGGDKRPQFLTGSLSAGQRLGVRGLRFSLQEESLMRSQVRAIIEASSPDEDVALLLPMVASAEETETAVGLIDQVASELDRKRPKIGAMIETPSALFELDEILRAADFVSVGTNDLTHFMLGAERTELGSRADQSIFHPSMLRALHHVAERASALNRPATVCGEAAGDPLSAAMLIGLGFRTLSMSPARASKVRNAIRSQHASVLAECAKQSLALRSRVHVARCIREALATSEDLGDLFN